MSKRTYSHVFDLSFSVESHRKDAKDVTNEDVLTALRQRIADLQVESAMGADVVADVWPPQDTERYA